MKTIKTIVVVGVAMAIASVVIRVAVLKRQAGRHVARENAERNANFERARNQPEPPTAPVVVSTAPKGSQWKKSARAESATPSKATRRESR